MTTHHYSITIDSLRHIPGDVLVEHLGYHLRAFADENGKVPHISLDDYAASPTAKVEFREGRAHPFDGPELFDDDFINEDETRKVRYTDGGPHDGVQYVDVSSYSDTEVILAPAHKDPVYDGFVPVQLSEKDKELLNQAIATDFPYLSALFNHKRVQ